MGELEGLLKTKRELEGRLLSSAVLLLLQVLRLPEDYRGRQIGKAKSPRYMGRLDTIRQYYQTLQTVLEETMDDAPDELVKEAMAALRDARACADGEGWKLR